jgi:hypothetical protein
MSDGGLSIHRVGKELGARRWEKGLSDEPTGLSPGNNILILFQKQTCAFLFILSVGKGTCKGMHDVECMQFPG